ncbi:MAG: HEAT repeat domain-containing protein [Herpetosiphonaceae bacterium]|nr:HEAT repeat domain-containing protein [Herpetosiphonaceae bacterium]
MADEAPDAPLAETTITVADLVRAFQSESAAARTTGVSLTISGGTINITNLAGRDLYQQNEYSEALYPILERMARYFVLIGEREQQPTAADLAALEQLYRQQLIEAHRSLTFQGILQTNQPIALPLAELYVAGQSTSEMGEGDTVSPEERRLIVRLHEAGPTKHEHLEQELALLNRRRWNLTPRRVDITTALRDYRTLVVLGDPGAGKSTLLRYLTLTFAEDAAAERLNMPESRLPILVPLAAYGAALAQQPRSLFEFLGQYYAEQHELPGLTPLFGEALDSGRVLVLLDGLDEVQSSEIRRSIAERVQTFISRYTQLGNRVVLTSRIVGYRAAPMAAEFPHYTLLDFGPAEIDRFTRQWCRAFELMQRGDTRHAIREAAAEQRRLFTAINANPSVAKLAGNPLLLTILALIHRQGKSLPRRRIELYDLYARTLLESWNRARSLSGHIVGKALDVLDTVKVMAPLALWLHSARPDGTARFAELQRELRRIFTEREASDPEREALQWLIDVREHSGLLVERGADAWGFIHRTFQEYFAARAVAVLPAEERFARIRPHLHNPGWQEVILLTAGQIGVMNADEAGATAFVRSIHGANSLYPDILHRDLLLAAAILGDDVGVKPSLTRTIARELGELWWTGHVREPVVVAISGLVGLECLGLALEPIYPALNDRAGGVHLDAIKVFGVAQQWETLRPLLSDPDEWTRQAAVAAFSAGQQWEAIRPVLRDRSKRVRRTAVEAFGASQQWGYIRSALTGETALVRSAAVYAFGRGQQWEMIRFALHDESVSVREAAVEAFGTGPEWAAVEPALDDPDWEVRRAAVEVFGAHQQWDKIRAALSDHDDDVRSAAVSAFGAGEHWEAIRPALSDPHSVVRRAAISAFGSGGHWEAIRPALRAEDPDMRSVAVTAFGAGEHWEVIRQALFDPSARVRDAAVTAYAAYPTPALALIAEFAGFAQVDAYSQRLVWATLAALIERYEAQQVSEED